MFSQINLINYTELNMEVLEEENQFQKHALKELNCAFKKITLEESSTGTEDKLEEMQKAMFDHDDDDDDDDAN